MTMTNFFTKITACFGDLAQFEQKIQQIADIANIPLHQFNIDHLAVRMNSEATAQQWKNLLLAQADLVKESQINDRPISIFHLHQPLTFLSQQVSVIELPFPKCKYYHKEGWEHIELVVPMLEQESVEQWVKRLCQRWKLGENLQIQLKISQPQGKNERLPNPTIAISLRDETLLNPYCLKLHPYDITTIVHSEN